MTKLTNAKISWIVRSVLYKRINPKQAAEKLGITKRRVNQLVKQYTNSKMIPKLKPWRKPATQLTNEQKQWIDQAWEHHRVGNRLLHYVLKAEGKPVPKNKIHTYRLETGKSFPDKRKQGKRKRCRYERQHSGSLLHTDWHLHPDGTTQVLIIEDDASRFVLSGVETTNATAEVTVACTEQAYALANEWNLHVNQFNTDRGSQFYNNQSTQTTSFQDLLIRNGTRHVPSRVNNPQTNGKNERFWQEYDKHRQRFPLYKRLLTGTTNVFTARCA